MTFATVDLSFHHDSEEEFLDAWAARYKYSIEHLYDDNIGQPLCDMRLWDLFTWKNGGPISTLKQASIRKNYLGDPPDNPEATLLDPAGPGGAIWNIFYLHCLDPHRWPIYDQHAHRAMIWILEQRIDELPTIGTKSAKGLIYSQYQEMFIPFIRDYFACNDQRRIDMAIFSFGQWLKKLNALFDLSNQTPAQ